MLPSVKELIPNPLTSNAIYKVNGSGCDSGYVCLTTRHIITRHREHLIKKCAVRHHVKECENGTNFEPAVDILDRTNRSIVYLRVLEALHIREI